MITTLATDLDGTFIPLNDATEHRQALREIEHFLAEHQISLVFVSGRSWKLIEEAIEAHGLPLPDIAICDVGTRIRVRGEGTFQDSQPYAEHLRSRLQPWSNAQLLAVVDQLSGAIWPQPEDCQTEFKTSFFFELAAQDRVTAAVRDWREREDVPVTPIVSKQIDGDLGLLDLLPQGVHKGFALRWWLSQSGTPLSSVVFCGDSGNDSAAILSEMNGVAVGNADRHLRESIGGRDDETIYQARAESTSGVWEGLTHYHNRLCRSQDVH